MVYCWVDIQISVISKITHSSVQSYRLRPQRGVNFSLLRQLLFSEAPSDLPPPVFLHNYHHAQPTVLSVGICSYITKVSIDDRWKSYYQPNPPYIFHSLFCAELSSATTYSSVRWKILEFRELSTADCCDSYYWLTKSSPDLPPSIFARNYYQEQTTGLYVIIDPDFIEVSIDDCWDICYSPNPFPISHPLFLLTNHSSVHWNRLRLHIGVSFLLLLWEYGRRRITLLWTATFLVSST